MKILSKENLVEAVEIISNGGVIIYPTETTYGIGCDAFNQTAVNKIYEIKARPKDKPVLVLVDSVAMARKYWQWNEYLEVLTDKYWPGALTIRALANEAGKKLAQGVVDVDDIIAIRFSAHPVARKLVELLGRPLVSTSANIYGDKEIYDGKILQQTFSNRLAKPDALVDCGVLPFNLPSTLIDVTGDELKILRQGEVVIDIN